tara:strand:+ start:914 stop:1240 length:327 start_codon:yes stop_codon:yes gene_type:complete
MSSESEETQPDIVDDGTLTTQQMKRRQDDSNGNRVLAMRPTTAIVFLVSGPIIAVWLYLAYRIIDGAISKSGVLDNIEGLLTALAVLTIPATKIVDKLYDKWLGHEDD